MPLIRSTGIEDPQDSIYGCGHCHTHAIAAARVHGPSDVEPGFLVVIDHDQPHWVDEADPDNVLATVIHVYSLHGVDGEVIARDVLGDRLEQDAERECADLYAIGSPDSYRCSLDELLDLTQGRETEDALSVGCENPLAQVSEAYILEAMTEPSVTAPISIKMTEEVPEP